MTDEHARFIATGYTEARWQEVLEHRRTWRLRQAALRDWQVEQDLMVPDKTTVLKSRIVGLENRVKELQGQQPVVIDNNREERL